MPAALENRVFLPESWEYAYRIFSDLSCSRPPAFDGRSEIPFSEFYMYADMHEYPKPLARELWREVRLLDSIYLEVLHKVHEEKRSQSKSNGSKKPSK